MLKKLSLALAVGTGLALGGGATTPAHASPIPILSLDPTNLSASIFNSLFTPLASLPEMSSGFTYMGLSPNTSGVIESQVFEGHGKEQGVYAYAY